MRTTPYGRTPSSRSLLATRQPFLTCSTNCFRSASEPIAEPPPVGGQTGATTEPITSLRERTLSASFLRSSSDESMSTCGANRNRSTPSNLTPSTCALAVRSSMVSSSMNGSAPAEPLPTTPGQAALCNFGYVFFKLMRLPLGLGLFLGLRRIEPLLLDFVHDLQVVRTTPIREKLVALHL